MILIFYVQARDIDKTSEVIYSIVDGNINNLFSIDSLSGEVTVTDRNGLDMTNISSDTIRLVIQVRIFNNGERFLLICQ